MKTTLLSLAALFATVTSQAQYTQNFESGENNMTGNCWVLTDVHYTNNPAYVITGTGSMYTNPPTGASTRDLVSPALNVVSTNFTVTFNYKVTSKISGAATRTIEVGLLAPNNVFTSLQLITMDKNTPTTVQSFNQTFTLASTGFRKLVVKFGGSTGDGNSRIIFDDLYASASPLYGTGTCNTAPVAVNDNFNGLVGAIVTGNVKSNDYDPNGEMINSAVVATSADGILVLNPNGSFTFTPSLSFIGTTTSFTYNLTDNGFDPATSNTATVTINYLANIPLPVKLTSFSAQLTANTKVDLKWSTATEMNASHFVIEKSADGKTYSDAGVVFAAGNSTSVNNYQYTDNIGSTDKTVFYYRLRMVDADGKFEYSAVRIIRIGKQNETSVTILTYPNPVTSEVRITIPANWQGKKTTYEIVNANGQTVKRIESANSSQTENINTSNLARGFYMVKVSCANETAIQKIIKQ